MTTDSVDSLDELAEKVDEAFASHRHANEFKSISLVIDSSTADRPTLIIHVDGEDAGSVADRIEKFCTKHGAHTQREHHSETDIRVLATVE